MRFLLSLLALVLLALPAWAGYGVPANAFFQRAPGGYYQAPAFLDDGCGGVPAGAFLAPAPRYFAPPQFFPARGVGYGIGRGRLPGRAQRLPQFFGGGFGGGGLGTLGAGGINLNFGDGNIGGIQSGRGRGR
jgi:hypothetical protein